MCAAYNIVRAARTEYPMNATNLFLAAALCLSPGDDPKATGDAAKLQGTWEFAALEIEGAKTPQANLAGSRIEIVGDKFTTTTGPVVYKGSFKVDPTQKPKAIDMTFTEGPETGK